MRIVILLILSLFIFGCDEELTQKDISQKDKVIVNERCAAGTFSPDGTKIAWSREKYKGLFWMDLSDSTYTEISSKDMAGWKFSWAPDNSGIAFREKLENSRFTILKRDLNKDSNELVGEFSDPVYPPVWRDSIYSVNILRSSNISLAKRPVLKLKSPLRKLKFNAFVSSDRVSIIDLSSGKINNLPKGTHSPALSPDGTRLLFVERNSIKILDLENGSMTDAAQGSSPSWSGTKIVFTQTVDDGKNVTFSAVKAFDINSGKIYDITIESGRIPLFPSLSSDGTKLLYTDGVSGNLLIHSLTEEGRK